MKFAKKIALCVLMMALLISSTVFFASADFTVDNIEEVLEYYLTEEFVREDLNSEDALGVVEALSNEYTTHQVVTDTDDASNFLWYIRPETMRNANLVMKLNDMQVDKVVLSTRVKFGEPLDDGSAETLKKAPKFDISLKIHKENGLWDSSTFFRFDFQENKIVYFSYDETTGRINEENVLASPEYGKWYDIDIAFNFEKGSYGFTLTKDSDTDNAVKCENVSVGPFVSTSEIRMFLTESRRAQMWLDRIDLYEGSFVREISSADKESTVVEYIKKLDALSKTDISIDDQLRIAEVYRILFLVENFTPNPSAEYYDEATALIEADRKYINATYKNAILEYVEDINEDGAYIDRVEYLEKLDELSALLPTDETEFNACAGIVSGDFALVESARASIQAERDALAEIKEDCDAYIARAGMYEPDNKDYSYMTDFILGFDAFDKFDTTYPGALEAKTSVVDVLGAKIEVIEEISDGFIALVDRMQAIFANVGSNKICGDGFEELYYELFLDRVSGNNSIKGAESIYNGGVLHPGLDNSTYDGLNEKIDVYLEIESYINSRVESCEAFITEIRLANSATQYTVIKEKAALAYKYIDENLDDGFTVEDKYKGVSSAKSDYAYIMQRLAQSEANAQKYVADAQKVSAAMNGSYTALKAALSKALDSKKTGDITGMTGVKDANIALAKAQALVDSYENYSKVLVDSAKALDAEGLTLSARRALINTAIDAKAKSTDEIKGVSDAKTKLDAAVAQYNTDIASANAVFESAFSTAGELATAVVPTERGLWIVEAFKALFKKEN